MKSNFGLFIVSSWFAPLGLAGVREIRARWEGKGFNI